jgi:hypothetical protein
MELQERFKAFDNSFLKFKEIPQERRLSERADLHAFLLLEKLAPQTGRIIAGAAHDEIFLGVDCEKLNAAASDDDIRDLIRCGVRMDDTNDGLMMFA